MGFFGAFLADQAGRGRGEIDRQKDDEARASSEAKDKEQKRQFDADLAERSKRDEAYAAATNARADLTVEQTIKQRILNANLPEAEKARIALMVDRGDLTGAQTALANARVGLVGAQVDLTNQNTKLSKARETEIYQGKIPLEKASADYKRAQIHFDQEKIDNSKMKMSMDSRAKAESLAGRLELGKVGSLTRLAVAYMAQENVERGQDLRAATQTAIAQYTQESQNYRAQVKADPGYTGAAPTAPNVNVQLTTPGQQQNPLEAYLMAKILRENGVAPPPAPPAPGGGGYTRTPQSFGRTMPNASASSTQAALEAFNNTRKGGGKAVAPAAGETPLHARIRTAIAAGGTDDQIKRILGGAGYTAAQITAGLAEARR